MISKFGRKSGLTRSNTYRAKLHKNLSCFDMFVLPTKQEILVKNKSNSIEKPRKEFF